MQALLPMEISINKVFGFPEQELVVETQTELLH